MKRLILAPLLACLALGGCTGLNIGWGAVQQAAPGSAALSIDPGCHGQVGTDLPCMSITGAQNMDAVKVDIGRDPLGKPTFHLEAQGIDPARNQAIAAQALSNTVDKLGAITQTLAPIAATALGGPAAGAAAGVLTRPLAAPTPLGPLPSTTISGQGVQVQP